MTGLSKQFLCLAMLFGFAGAALHAQAGVVISVANSAGRLEQVAAQELLSHLSVLSPGTHFKIGGPSPSEPVIYLGVPAELPSTYTEEVRARLTGADSFVVKDVGTAGSPAAIIAGGSPRAVLYAVDTLLEQLGFGAYLSYNTAPAPREGAFSFAGWDIEDAPLVRERVIFDWHNFLSGCSTWNLEDWEHWITQAERMRFNTIMVHAYGNNPMFSFSLNGQTKPTGYLTNTELGRDWGTEHVLDVRKTVGAGDLFNGPVFGAEASLVPDAERVPAAEGLMQHVFEFAAERGMGITFALDVDTESANPQNVIRTLPEAARFQAKGFWMVDPDTEEGYKYYRAEIEQLMKLYPQMTQLAVWFRCGLNSPWRELVPGNFPNAWHAEYEKAMQPNPRLRNDPEAPSLFAISKIAKAFRKALDETGHSNITMTAGSWRFTYLPAADAFMPADVGLMPLDYDYAFPSDPVQESLRAIGRHRSVIPIIWAQHDDREYAGRSYTPFAGLGSTLRWGNASGYGVIHWTTRPLDLFFKNVSQQVWEASQDETLDKTASEMAARTFGVKAAEFGKQYLLDWIHDGPAFGEETTDRFINRNHVLDVENEAIGARKRLALLEQMKPLAANADAREWIAYFEDWENYAREMYEAQSALQKSYGALESGNVALARQEIQKAHPESAIEQYAKTIRHGQISRGEEGILITLNLRWLPYFEAQRQALGLEPLTVEFAPTAHEPLAQGAGHFTFDFDAAHRVIEVLGTQELGTEIHSFPAGSACTNGIDVSAPVQLAIGGLAGTDLLPGIYRIRLKTTDNVRFRMESDASSHEIAPGSEVEVKASEGKVRFTLAPVSGSARFCGLTLEQSAQ